MLWDSGTGATEEEMDALASQMVDAGCRYAVCGGQNCEAWHDSVDRAKFAVARVKDYSDEELDKHFIMTTWHTDETIKKVVWFAVHCTEYDDIVFRYVMVLVLGGNNRNAKTVERRVRKEASNWAPD
jgi:hypothetical protein